MSLEIRRQLRQLYLNDPRPWLVGYSGGKDSTMLASLIFYTIESIPREQRTKPVSVLCTDTRVEMPAIVDMIVGETGVVDLKRVGGGFERCDRFDDEETILGEELTRPAEAMPVVRMATAQTGAPKTPRGFGSRFFVPNYE